MWKVIKNIDFLSALQYTYSVSENHDIREAKMGYYLYDKSGQKADTLIIG